MNNEELINEIRRLDKAAQDGPWNPAFAQCVIPSILSMRGHSCPFRLIRGRKM